MRAWWRVVGMVAAGMATTCSGALAASPSTPARDAAGSITYRSCAVFTPTQIQGLPDTYTPGREIAVQIVGDLKIREVTRPTTFAAKLRFDGETITGDATTTIHMTDFGFDPPSILGVLKAQNEAKLEFQFLARHAQ